MQVCGAAKADVPVKVAKRKSEIPITTVVSLFMTKPFCSGSFLIQRTLHYRKVSVN
jgi:hypothetical protein